MLDKTMQVRPHLAGQATDVSCTQGSWGDPLTRVFLVRAGHGNELLADFLKRGIVSVGWKRLGDLSAIQSPARIESMLRKEYPEGVTRSGRIHTHYAEIIEFAVVAKPGDYVATVDGVGGRIIVGRIAGPYKFDDVAPLESGGEPYRHTLPVNWEFAVARDKEGKYSFPDTRLRNATARWLKPATADALLSAPRLPLTGYPGIAKRGARRTESSPQPMDMAPIDEGAVALQEWLGENERRAALLPLNELAVRAGKASVKPRQIESTSSTYVRDSFVAAYAKKAAGGVCALCGADAPFRTTSDEPYLESHHIDWLSRGGHDSTDNVVALCPNCHRKMHVVDSAVDRAALVSAVAERDRRPLDS